MDNSDILLIGSHRSGSTWVGKVIASSPTINYIHEPFNLGSNRKWNSPVKNWFEIIDNQSSINKRKTFQHYITKILRYDRYYTPIVSSIKKKTFPNPVNLFNQHKKFRNLVKDPLASLSAEWLHQQFNFSMIMLLRHPAAFAASLKSAKWEFDFIQLLSQNQILPHILKAHSHKIENLINSNQRNNIIDQAILLWDIIYSSIYSYHQDHPDWIVVKHEDLSKDPISEYKSLFNKLDIEFTELTTDYINSTTKAHNDTLVERNSLDNIYKWKKILTIEEQDYIFNALSNHHSNFYTPNDWI